MALVSRQMLAGISPNTMPSHDGGESNRRFCFINWLSFIASYIFQSGATNSEYRLG